MLVGITIYLIIMWGSIPDQIPGHFNASGEVTRWDSKSTLVVMPVIAFVMFVGMTILERFPRIWNTGVRVTQENMHRIYRVLKSMLNTMKLVVTALLITISLIQSLTQTLPIWFLPVFLVLIFGTIIFYIVRLVMAR